MTRKVMRLVNPRTGEMECKICGAVHIANLRGGGFYRRGSWQCRYGCRFEEKPTKEKTANKPSERGER